MLGRRHADLLRPRHRYDDLLGLRPGAVHLRGPGPVGLAHLPGPADPRRARGPGLRPLRDDRPRRVSFLAPAAFATSIWIGAELTGAGDSTTPSTGASSASSRCCCSACSCCCRCAAAYAATPHWSPRRRRAEPTVLSVAGVTPASDGLPLDCRNLRPLSNVEDFWSRIPVPVTATRGTERRRSMAERTLRGARLGGQSFEDERGIEFAARQQVDYVLRRRPHVRR